MIIEVEEDMATVRKSKKNKYCINYKKRASFYKREAPDSKLKIMEKKKKKIMV